MTTTVDENSLMSDIIAEMRKQNGRISLEDNKKYLMESPFDDHQVTYRVVIQIPEHKIRNILKYKDVIGVVDSFVDDFVDEIIYLDYDVILRLINDISHNVSALAYLENGILTIILEKDYDIQLEQPLCDVVEDLNNAVSYIEQHSSMIDNEFVLSSSHC